MGISSHPNHQVLQATFHLGYHRNITSSVIRSLTLSHKCHCAGQCLASGCSSFFYNSLSAVCQLHCTVFDSEDTGVARDGSQYYYRRGGFKNAIQGDPDRLLMVALYRRQRNAVFQLNLHNMSKTRYQNLKLRLVNAVTYIWTSRKLLIAGGFPDMITAYTLNTHVSEKFMTGLCCMSMAVDQGRQLIFVTTVRPKITVTRMTTKGEGLTRVITEKIFKKMYTLLLVPKQTMFFVSYGTKVMSADYDGKNRMLLIRSSRSMSLTLDPERLFLYYSQKRNLYKKNTKEEGVTAVRSFNQDIVGLYYFESKVVVKSKSTDLHIIDVVHNTVRVLRKIFPRGGNPHWQFCVVP